MFNRKEYVRKYRQTHRKEYNEYMNKWQKEHPQTHRKASKKWNKNHREKHREINNKWDREHPKIKKAWNFTHNHHIPLGSKCELCPDDVRTEKLERHHPDYEYPDIIVTVCKECHEGLINA